jgi:hypothetical protein
MKKINLLIGVCCLSIQCAFAQNQAMFIDTSGNVGINTSTPAAMLDVNGSVNISGDLNGVKIYKFTGNQSPYIMKDIVQQFYTMTISYSVNCTSPGVSAIVLYDANNRLFKIVAQAGSGLTNRVEISSSAPNALIFYNDCGMTTILTFIPSNPGITANVTFVNNNPNQLPITPSFNIICQGF